MDYKDDLEQAGHLTKEMGKLLIKVSRNDNIDGLRHIRNQMVTMISVIDNVIMLDCMEKARNN